jgi:hypothetical protein
MQVIEFSKGSDTAIGVTVAPESVEAFMAELRKVKAALLDWKSKHQNRCELVMFTIVCNPEDHAAIESVLKQVYDEEKELSPLLQSVNVEVALLNKRGKPVKEYNLGKRRLDGIQQTKPWWKFW